jgi:hypothetical protein
MRDGVGGIYMKILEMVKRSDWKTGKGVDPHCIVLLKLEKGGSIEYTTHEMVKRPGVKEPAFYSGHYFTTLGAAAVDFKKRIEKRA